MRPIDADWFKELVLSKKETDPYIVGVIINAIDSMPTIEERKKGEWTDLGGVIRWGCPHCHYAQVVRYNFCPHCGADMRGEE